MKLALIQMKPVLNNEDNINMAISFLEKSKENGADIAILPEMFICQYNTQDMMTNAMPEYHPLIQKLKQKAKELNIILVAGSFPESDGDKIYNTSLVFDNNGNTIAKHRKAHLFDINIENGQKFKESDVFTAGDCVTTFETPFGKLGLMICYDVRFPELTRKMALDGVMGVIVPAAFNMTTGPAHWELTFRSRALDNQIFMAGISSARDENSTYTAWGHSISTNPWGEVLFQADEQEGVSIVEWDFEKLTEIRQQLPLLLHRRESLY